MSISLTNLRAHLYKIVDEVIATGVPVEIERHGKIVKIIAEVPQNKLNHLTVHKNVMNCDPEDLVHCDWSKDWHEENNL